MKKNISVLSVLGVFIIGFFVLHNQIQSGEVRASLFGDGTSESNSALTSSPQYDLGIGAIPLQEKDGEPASSFNFTGDPGSQLEGKIRLLNQNNDTDLIADIYVVGSNTNSSLPTPMSRKNPGPEAGWIDIAKNVPLPKGELEDVPFTITIPSNARPGDHTLSFMIETMRPEDASQIAKNVPGKQGAKIKISSAVGVRVLLKVTGKEMVSAKVKALTMTSENPYIFNIAVENNGNVTVKPNITTVIDSTFGMVPLESVPLSTSYEILPGGVANMITVWDYQKIGIYKLRFTIAYGDEREVREVKVVIYPSLSQIAIAVSLLFILIAAVLYYRRRKKQDPPSVPPSQSVPPPPLPPSVPPSVPSVQQNVPPSV